MAVAGSLLNVRPVGLVRWVVPSGGCGFLQRVLFFEGVVGVVGRVATPSVSGSKVTKWSETDFWCRALIDSGCRCSRVVWAVCLRFDAVRCGVDSSRACSNLARASFGSEKACCRMTGACR